MMPALLDLLDAAAAILDHHEAKNVGILALDPDVRAEITAAFTNLRSSREIIVTGITQAAAERPVAPSIVVPGFNGRGRLR